MAKCKSWLALMLLWCLVSEAETAELTKIVLPQRQTILTHTSDNLQGDWSFTWGASSYKVRVAPTDGGVWQCQMLIPAPSILPDFLVAAEFELRVLAGQTHGLDENSRLCLLTRNVSEKERKDFSAYFKMFCHSAVLLKIADGNSLTASMVVSFPQNDCTADDGWQRLREVNAVYVPDVETFRRFFEAYKPQLEFSEITFNRVVKPGAALDAPASAGTETAAEPSAPKKGQGGCKLTQVEGGVRAETALKHAMGPDQEVSVKAVLLLAKVKLEDIPVERQNFLDEAIVNLLHGKSDVTAIAWPRVLPEVCAEILGIPVRDVVMTNFYIQ